MVNVSDNVNKLKTLDTFGGNVNCIIFFTFYYFFWIEFFHYFSCNVWIWNLSLPLLSLPILSLISKDKSVSTVQISKQYWFGFIYSNYWPSPKLLLHGVIILASIITKKEIQIGENKSI